MIAACIAALVLLGAIPQAEDQSTPVATATVRGRIVAADTGTPLRGAYASISSVPSPSSSSPPDLEIMIGRVVPTSWDGSFEFRGLAPGRYKVAGKPSEQTAQFLRSPAELAIDIAAGETSKPLVIRLPRGGVISGRVIDAGNAPVTLVSVYALLVAGDPPGRTRPYTSEPSDDLGSFRIYGLPDGEYVVGTQLGRSFRSAELAPADDILPTFYPSTTSEAAARRVRVRAGAETANVDVHMAEGRRARVTGVILDADGAPLRRTVGFVNRLAERMGGSPGAAFTTGDDGRFEVRDLAPGEYRLTTRKLPDADANAPVRAMEAADVPLEIAGVDLENLIVKTRRGTSLQGRLTFDPPRPEAVSRQPATITIANRDGSCSERSSMTMQTDEDGAFQAGDLFCAYLVRASVPGYVVKSVELNGVEIIDTPHWFADGDRVAVLLTSRTSTIDGTATDDAGNPVGGCDVITFAQDPARWTSSGSTIHRTVIDGKGRFRIDEVLPGRYFVIAGPRPWLAPPLPFDSTFFERLSQDAMPVTIGEEDQRTVELRVTAPRDR